MKLGEKGQFWKDIFEIFNPLLSEDFKKIVCSVDFSPVAGRRQYSCSSGKRDLQYTRFYGFFPKFSVQLFCNTFMKSPVTKCSRVLDYRLCRLWTSSVLYFSEKLTPQEITFRSFWRWNYQHKNVVCDGLLSWQRPTIFLRTDLSTDVVLQVIVKSITFKTRSYDGIQF